RDAFGIDGARGDPRRKAKRGASEKLGRGEPASLRRGLAKRSGCRVDVSCSARRSSETEEQTPAPLGSPFPTFQQLDGTGEISHRILVSEEPKRALSGKPGVLDRSLGPLVAGRQEVIRESRQAGPQIGRVFDLERLAHDSVEIDAPWHVE